MRVILEECLPSTSLNNLLTFFQLQRPEPSKTTALLTIMSSDSLMYNPLILEINDDSVPIYSLHRVIGPEFNKAT